MFSRPYVVVSLDKQALDTRLDVLSDVPGLRKGIAVAYAKWDVEFLAQCPSCLSALEPRPALVCERQEGFVVVPTLGCKSSRRRLDL